MSDDNTAENTPASPSGPPAPPPTGTAPTGGRVRPMAVQGAVNRVVRAMLRIPILSRLVGQGLLTLYVVGRTSGKHYTIPMAYLRHDGQLLLGSGFAWGKNLRTGDTIELRFVGTRRHADVRVLTDEAAVVEHYAIIARRNPGFAKLNKIAIRKDGTPDPTDLHAAWAAGARVFLLTLR